MLPLLLNGLRVAIISVELLDFTVEILVDLIVMCIVIPSKKSAQDLIDNMKVKINACSPALYLIIPLLGDQLLEILYNVVYII